MAPTHDPKPDPSRGFEKTVEIDAPAEAVWKAVSEPEELIRWFPLEADVEPGEGGSIRLSWGPGCEGTAPITAWEPLSRLAWTETLPASDDEGDSPRLVTELLIEGSKSGKTVVRLVQHGFDVGDEWDDLFDGLESGWAYFLWNLAHYLELHRGTPRDLIWARMATTRPRAEVWDRLFEPGGLLVTEDAPAIGDSYRLRLAGEQHGTVHIATPGAHFAGTVESLDDGLLFVELEGGDESWHCGFWLSTYGLAPERVEELRRDLEAVASAALAG